MEQALKKQIIFVDDEPKILDGLRRMLRGMRNEWDMSFSSGGIEALELMATKHFDVIVSDMRMPEMDGSQLLTKVKELYPYMVRIILSGQSDKESVMKTVKPAHQYLSKPCETEILKSTISRACDLKNLIVENDLKDLVSQIESLPSLPSLYMELVERLQSPESTAQQIGEIIAKDLGMTTKILQIVNSAFFSFPRHISNPSQAVILLGMDTIKSLVLCIGIFSQFEEKRFSCLEIRTLWDHNMLTGSMAKSVATSEGLQKNEVDNVFMAGLIHDVGKLILAENLPERYTEVFEEAGSQHIPLYEAELQILGATHAEVGAYLTALWGLPNDIVETIAYHHFPEKSSTKCISNLTIVHVVDSLEQTIEGSTFQDIPAPIINRTYMEQMGLVDKIPEWENLCMKIKRGGEKNESEDSCGG